MKHKKLLTNLLFAAVVLAIAAVLLLVRSAHSSGSKLRAELIYGDNNGAHRDQGRCCPLCGLPLPGPHL